MKNNLSVCLLAFSLFALAPLAQSQNTVAGSLVDAENQPIMAATVMLLQASDSSLIKGLLSPGDGRFAFESVGPGDYRVRVQMIGHTEYLSPSFAFKNTGEVKNLGSITLRESSTSLEEIAIVARRPFLEQKIDRTVVNVAGSITNAGGNALQVLERSPGVQVNALTKSISLAGKQGVVVMINGKISRLPSEAVVDMLSGMNADNIDRIELIHTPPANFDAEGNAGIINIILKSNADAGFNGGYSAKAGYGKAPKYGAGLYFNYRKNKVNLYGNYDYDFNLNPQAFTNYRRIGQGSDILETDTYSDRSHTPTPTQNARLGADFQLSRKTVVGVLGTFFDRDWYMEAVNSTTYSKNGVVDSLLRMPNDETNRTRSFAGNVNIAHQISAQQTLNLDVDYIDYDISNPSHYKVENMTAAGQITSQKELQIGKNTPIQVAVFKGDYSLNFGAGSRLELGGKYSSFRFENDILVEQRRPSEAWSRIENLSNTFGLNEDISAAYTSFSTKIGQKTEFKAGLRYEYTDTNLGSEKEANIVDKEYGSLFPSLYLSRTFSETHSLNLSYSRRITRPSIRRLAPWLIFSDPTTTEGGNPALQPTFIDAVMANYSLKSWRLGLSYSKEKNPVSYVQKVDEETNTQVNSFENLKNMHNANATLSFPWSPVKWWSIQNQVYGNYTAFNFELEGKALRGGNVSYGFNSNHTFTLPHAFILEITGDYNSPSFWGVALWKATGSLNIGVEKNFGPKWGKLRFNANDLFLSSNWYGTLDQPDIGLFVKSSYQFAERVFMLSWSNTFGNNKLKSARQRQVGSAEEFRRI